MSEGDSAAKLEEARRRLPLRRLMEQHGIKLPAGKNFVTCPFGDHGGAGLFALGSQELFKCHNTNCPTAGKALDEIGFLECHCGISRTDAWQAYLKEAGVWVEARLSPSVMPGQRKRKSPPPELPEETNLPAPEPPLSSGETGTSPEPVGCLPGDDTQATQTTVPVDVQVDEETRHASPDQISPSPDPGAPTPPRAGEAPPLSECDEDEDLIQQCVEVIRAEQKASVSLLQRRLRLGYARAARIMDELEQRGVVGPAKGAEPRDILIDLPPASAGGTAPPGADAMSTDSVGSGAPDIIPLNIIPLNGKRPGTPIDAVPLRGGGGGGGEEPPAGAMEGGSVPPAYAALRWFYAKLTWADSDREECWTKRGLTAETCEIMGLRSNVEANKEILLAMANHFPSAVLVEAGLYTQGERPKDPPKPSAQFYGYGLIARGKKGADGQREDDTWGWSHPILIPYFDEAGEVVHLRPHKGGAKSAAPRLFMVRRRKGHLLRLDQRQPVEYAIITEGEFKGMALWQALARDHGDEVQVATLPGITMAKPLFGDIEDWLDVVFATNSRRQVIVSYDNEEKGDPALPGYTEKPYRRHDAQIWARYLARRLTREGYDGKVCLLPKEWRDAKGKADWDGALALLVRDFLAELEGDAVKRPPTTDGQWLAARAFVRGKFLPVIQTAGPVNEQWQFFEKEEERLIQNGLERICYEPQLPHGGDSEEAAARRLQRVARKVKGTTRLPSLLQGELWFLSKRYLELRGRYYVVKKPSDKRRADWMAALVRARDDGDVEVRRAAELAILGVPESVSDFVMECHYVLIPPDGKRSRLVTLKNVHGKSADFVELPATPFSQPSKFREWLLWQGGFTWRAGERELNDLQADVARESARLEVIQVPVRGWHEESKMWFFDDVAYTTEGQELRPDAQGIVWNNHHGFRISARDHEGQEFSQKDGCRMQPGVQTRSSWKTRPEATADPKVAALAVQELFKEVADKMFGTLSSYDAFMVLGLMFAMGAGPEIFNEHTAFPGLWVHGEKGQGKSSLVRWLIRIWGFKCRTGLPLSDSTKVGISIAMQQYGNLWVWLEEFQASAAQWMIEKIKNLFNRESGIKKTFDEGRREVRGSAIVTGVATAQDAQVRSRYAHVQVSQVNRAEDHFKWFETESPGFFFLGRHILRHRPEFCRLTMESLQYWMDLPEVQAVDDPRAVLVHGVAYAGFVAMEALLKEQTGKGTLIGTMALDFRHHLLSHCRAQVQEVDRSVNVNQFWTDLMAAWEVDAFGETPADRRRLFLVLDAKTGAEIPDWELETVRLDPRKAWRSYLLYFPPEPVINAVRQYKIRMGVSAFLERSDLQMQMKTRPYWVASPHDGGHRQRFHGVKGTKGCWCIHLDFHELGRQKITREQWLESLHPQKEDGSLNLDVGIAHEDWVDPRRGDLFALVDSLKSEKPE